MVALVVASVVVLVAVLVVVMVATLVQMMEVTGSEEVLRKLQTRTKMN